MRTWLAGENESAVLGRGWYGRGADWYGLPFRESCPEAELRFRKTAEDHTLHLLLAAPPALHQADWCCRVQIHAENYAWVFRPPLPATGWQVFQQSLERVPAGDLVVRFESPAWCPDEFEHNGDRRQLGLLFAGAFIL